MVVIVGSNLPHEAIIGYIAGFLDGEGSIRARNRQVTISFYNTNFDVIQKIQEFLFGFGIYSKIYVQREQNNKWKRLYELDICRKNDIKTLVSILEPYLIIKKEQAKLVLGYYENKIGVEEKLKVLNKRGI